MLLQKMNRFARFRKSQVKARTLLHQQGTVKNFSTWSITNRNNEIYVWGSIGEEMIKKPTQLFKTQQERKRLFNDSPIIDAACGSEHVIFLTQDGFMYALGNNQFGQCARNPATVHFLNEPALVDTSHLNGEQPIRFKSVHCSRDSTLAITMDGKGLCAFGLNDTAQLGMGFNKNGYVHRPRMVPLREDIDHILDLYCGARHNFLKCQMKDGHVKLFCWGSNQFGELSLGHFFNQNEIVEAAPTNEGDGSLKCKEMCCGLSHSTLLSDNNLIYSSGRGTEGQLGFSSKLSPHWKLVENIPQGEIRLTGGMSHTLVSTRQEDGTTLVYGWGNHIFDGPTSDPQLLLKLGSMDGPVTMSSGANHSFIKVGNRLLAIGSGTSYQLGQGERTNVEASFVEVPHPNTESISMVRAGFSLSLTIGKP